MPPKPTIGSTTPADAVERESSLPNITALRAFVLAAQYRNFSRAAEELGITQSGVSRAVRSIEDASGVKLFERTGHGLVLTEPGSTFLEEVSALLSELGSATLRLSTYKSTSEQLRLVTLPSLGAKWLAGRLPRFLKQNPTIDLTVSSQIGRFDFENTELDAAIHYGNESWPGTLSDFLMDEVLLASCSPVWLKGTGPARAEALFDIPLIQHTHRPTAWREWFREIGIQHPRPHGGPRFEQYSMGLEAAAAGMGAILMPPYMILDELAAGRLVPLHKALVRSPWKYYVVYPRGKRSKPAVQRLRTWLRGEARATMAETLRLFPEPNA